MVAGAAIQQTQTDATTDAGQSVPKGYKRTELGVIPEDWEVKTLGGFVALRRGHDLTEKERKKGLVPVFGSAGLNGYHNQSIAKGPGVVLGRSGASFGQAHYCPVDFWPHNTALYVTDFLGNHPLFAYYLLKSFDFSHHNTGGAQQSLNRNFIAPLPIAVPLPHEQRIIVEALSDVDGWVASLDALIAKKRDLKTATMQQLLTGHTRLPGFTGEWKRKKLGELADIRSGGTPSTYRNDYWDGDILWCTPTDITALNGKKFLSDTARKITPLGLKASSAELLPPQSIVMTSRATIGECAINALPVSTNQGFKNFLPRRNVNVHFLYYFLQTKKQDFINLCSGSTFLEISKTQLLGFESLFPPTTKEQTAIATILSDMDEEIATLEAEREKASAIKQGMMQELLTGKTRLV